MMKNYCSNKLYTPAIYDGHHFQHLKTKNGQEFYVHVIEPDHVTIKYANNYHNVFLPYQVFIHRVKKNINTLEKCIYPLSSLYCFSKENPISNSCALLFASYLPNTNYYGINQVKNSWKSNTLHNIPSVCFGGALSCDQSFLNVDKPSLIDDMCSVYSSFITSKFNHELYPAAVYAGRGLRNYVPASFDEDFVMNKLNPAIHYNDIPKFKETSSVKKIMDYVAS